jgi:hypothetical protein
MDFRQLGKFQSFRKSIEFFTDTARNNQSATLLYFVVLVALFLSSFGSSYGSFTNESFEDWDLVDMAFFSLTMAHLLKNLKLLVHNRPLEDIVNQY